MAKLNDIAWRCLGAFQPPRLTIVKKQELDQKRELDGDFPGGPEVKSLHFHCRGYAGSIPGGATKFPRALQCGQKIDLKKKRRNESWLANEEYDVFSTLKCLHF